MKEVQDSYIENYKTPLKEIQDLSNQTSLVHELEDEIWLRWQYFLN